MGPAEIGDGMHSMRFERFDYGGNNLKKPNMNLEAVISIKRDSLNNTRAKQRTGHGVAILLMLGLLTSCAPKESTWKEAVQLQSGEVLSVQRTISFKEYQPIGGGGGGSETTVSSLEVLSPVHADTPKRWSQPPLLPMVFDRDPDTNEWFIVATFYMCQTWHELGRPLPPYVEFRYRNGQWVRQPLSEKFIDRETNMLIPNQADVGRDHTLGSKYKIMSRPTIAKEYLRVLPIRKDFC